MNELWRLGATEISAGIRNRTFSAVEVTSEILDRIHTMNPQINAIVQQMPEQALAAAEKIDNKISAGEDPGSLGGVPVTVKVNIDQAGYATTNGLTLQKDHRAKENSPIVTNLENAGAIIVGRTNTPAFSMRWFTRNKLHGHTLNPRNRSLTPGGSSGGAAAAVASGIGAIGHGTDIAGSIRYPAYACGLQGIRPTLGRVPAVNLSFPDRHIGPQLTAVSGPIARSIDDLELALDAMSQTSKLDPWWVPAPKTGTKYPKTAALCTHPDGMNTAPQIIAALQHAATALKANGWKVEERDIPPMRQPMELQIKLWISEFHLDNGATIKKENDPDANFVYQQMGRLFSPPDLTEFMGLLQQRVKLTREWQIFLNETPLLLCPVSAELPFEDQLDVRSPKDFEHVVEAQMTQIGLPFTGLPCMSVSTGFSGDSPVGVQLVAGRFREDILFDAGRIIERESPEIVTSD